MYLKQRGSLIGGGVSSRSCGMCMGVSDDRQTAKHTLEPLVSEPSAFGDGVAVEKPERHKSPGTDQIREELIKGGGWNVSSEIHNLFVLCGIRRNFLSSGRNQELNLFIRRAIERMAAIIEAYHSYKLRAKLYPSHFCQGELHMQVK